MFVKPNHLTAQMPYIKLFPNPRGQDYISRSAFHSCRTISFKPTTSSQKKHKPVSLRDALGSRAEESLRKLLERPQRPPKPEKGKTEAKINEPMTKGPNEDDDDFKPLVYPFSEETKACTRETKASELTPTNFITAESFYKSLTMMVTEWLRKEGDLGDFQLMKDPALNEALEITCWADTIAEKNISVPEEIERYWEERLVL